MAKFKSKIKDFTLAVRVNLGSGETLNEGEFDFLQESILGGYCRHGRLETIN